MIVGILVLVAGLDPGANAAIVSVPMLLMGLGLGALASQLGAVTVSAVPDSQSAEVGGLQNTATNLGASLGTALIGAVLITTLSAATVDGIQDNPDVPVAVQQQATTELAAGVPFLSDTQLTAAMDEAGVSGPTADAVLAVNADARLEALRVACGLAALLAVLALFFTANIPVNRSGRTAHRGTRTDGSWPGACASAIRSVRPGELRHISFPTLTVRVPTERCARRSRPARTARTWPDGRRRCALESTREQRVQTRLLRVRNGGSRP
ncbi:putative drug resistance efflux domain protein [Rhodococcus sp. MTM3W5.2]|nr:putative drug resistance efflux domain protein [Rhodococcus sp. MTM3W5.2]